MSLIEIDPSLCIGCGQCVMCCPYASIRQTEKGKPPFFNEESGCIRCGHCVSICPKGALRHNELGSEAFVEYSSAWNMDEIELLLRTKRSVRRFLDKPLPRELIERLLTTASFAPTDANTQDRGFLVLTSRQAIDDLENVLVQGFRTWLEAALKQGVRETDKEIWRTRALIRAHEAGFHPTFRNAPCVICSYAKIKNVFGWYNCAVAMDYVLLQSHAAGLGSCIIGEAIYAPEMISNYLKVPPGTRIQSVITLGYPKEKYRRTVHRSNPSIIWR